MLIAVTLTVLLSLIAVGGVRTVLELVQAYPCIVYIVVVVAVAFSTALGITVRLRMREVRALREFAAVGVDPDMSERAEEIFLGIVVPAIFALAVILMWLL